MAKARLSGVQKEPPKPQILEEAILHILAIAIITRQGMPQMQRMDSNLMRASCNGTRLDQGGIPKFLNRLEIGHGRLAVTGHLDDPLATFEHILF